MNPGALRALEFDRIVAAAAALTVTPGGHERMLELRPSIDASRVATSQRATTEGTRALASMPGFPLRAPADLSQTLDALSVEGRPLESLRLLGLAEFLDSIDATRNTIRRLAGSYPLLGALADSAASFKNENADVQRKIDSGGEVVDSASVALAAIRERLRRQRARLRSTLDALVRGRDTAKYLQEQVVTDRNGRYVVMVKAEHRHAIPGLVHGASASGATLFLEPLETVDINNDVVTLQDAEAEEVRRILLALTDAYRQRPADLARTLHAATELDLIQARARLSVLVGGVEPVTSTDGTFELRAARHPLMIPGLGARGSGLDDLGLGTRGSGLENSELGTPGAGLGSARPDAGHDTGTGHERRSPSFESRIPSPESREFESRGSGPVPVDILLTPPTRVLIIAGPNTGGKTVALKTAGLLALMAQAGLHIPADAGSRVPVFQSIFADIGDEQSIAASLSTFSAHITNVVSMDRNLRLPTLILLDEVGAGTDPVEGGALGTAVIDHFRQRGAHLIATTHYDALKSYAATTQSVIGAGFGFNPETFAPTYQLVYGSPGRSLAIEIAARLGMPVTVIDSARANLTDREQQLVEHLARVDRQLHQLEEEHRQVSQERRTAAETERKLRAREESVRERELALKRRLEARLDDQLRDARREIEAVLESLKIRASELRQARKIGAATTADAGQLRAESRAALESVADRVMRESAAASMPSPKPASSAPVEAGARVHVGPLDLEGVVLELHGKQAEVEVRGKRLRVPVRDLQVMGGSGSRPAVRVTVDLSPREGSLTELNVIGCTVDEALTRVERFLDESTLTDMQELRIVHGHGTGQLRRAITQFLSDHPLVAGVQTAPQNQGGGGATIVTLKD
jgi:DNA mismatch repair protein MutS2